MSVVISSIVSRNEANILPLIRHHVSKNRYNFIHATFMASNITGLVELDNINQYYAPFYIRTIIIYLRNMYIYLNVKGYL